MNAHPNLTARRRIAYALIAVAEARLMARAITGDAGNAQPTALQLSRITLADMGGEGLAEAKKILAEWESQPLGAMLYASEGGFSAEALIREIRATLFA